MVTGRRQPQTSNPTRAGKDKDAPKARTRTKVKPAPRTLTMRDLVAYIGKRALWHVESLVIPIEIVDARSSFGRLDVLISPITGSGEKWVDINQLELPGEDQAD